MKAIGVLAIFALFGCGGSSGPDPANVVITAPLPAARIAGDFMITFTYHEPMEVNSVQARLDGIPVANSVYKAPDVDCVLWKSTPAQNGAHQLQLVIYDSGWHAHFSPKQLVTVAN